MGLRKQKGNMYEFVTHTWNVIKGKCEHDCKYCHPAGTKILMDDFSEKLIENIIIGDSIIGIKKHNNIGFYKFEIGMVTNTSKRFDKTLLFETDDGVLEATREHPLMGSTEKRNCSDWKSAKSFSPFQNLRFIGRYKKDTSGFINGYINGFCDGDGCFFKFKNTGTKNMYTGFEAVCIDKKLRNYFIKACNFFNIKLKIGTKQNSRKAFNGGGKNPLIYTKTQSEVKKLLALCDFNKEKTISFYYGYLSGMLDTDGHVTKNGTIRISQSTSVNLSKYNKIKQCCDFLNLSYKEEPNSIYIKGGFNERMRILFHCKPKHSIKSKRLLLGMTIKGSNHSMIKSISACNQKIVYNLETSLETFIANGFIVHNCYMKKWGKQSPLRFDEKELKTKLGKDKFVFVGSSTDMFADNVPMGWIGTILLHCLSYPENKYLFQTKNPERFYNFMFRREDILCITLETNRDISDISKAPYPYKRAMIFADVNHSKKMVTIEPIIDFDLTKFVKMIRTIKPFQVNIGADSMNSNLPEPSAEKINDLIVELSKFTKVFKKSNLKRIE